jgi:hypothetical protein
LTLVSGSGIIKTIQQRGAAPKQEKNMTSIIATYYDFEAAVIAAKTQATTYIKAKRL